MKTEDDRTGQKDKREGQSGTAWDRTRHREGQDSTGQNKTGNGRIGLDKMGRTGWDRRAGQHSTGWDGMGRDRTRQCQDGLQGDRAGHC